MNLLGNSKNQFPESEYISASKMDDDDIRLGGPSGAVSICYNSKLKCNVDTITTRSKSICAQTICTEGLSILLINVYMPCSNNKDKLDEYSSKF